LSQVVRFIQGKRRVHVALGLRGPDENFVRPALMARGFFAHGGRDEEQSALIATRRRRGEGDQRMDQLDSGGWTQPSFKGRVQRPFRRRAPHLRPPGFRGDN